MKASAVNRCVCAGFEPAGIRCPGKPEVIISNGINRKNPPYYCDMEIFLHVRNVTQEKRRMSLHRFGVHTTTRMKNDLKLFNWLCWVVRSGYRIEPNYTYFTVLCT